MSVPNKIERLGCNGGESVHSRLRISVIQLPWSDRTLRNGAPGRTTNGAIGRFSGRYSVNLNRLKTKSPVTSCKFEASDLGHTAP